VFSVGSHEDVNHSSGTYIAYCFHSVDGYSKVGSYTGNGLSDGTFVYTGFRPAYVMIKNADRGEPWVIRDTSRDTYNQSRKTILANSSAAEFDWNSLDILSNGFKLRSGGSEFNYLGENLIFIAFAETPFKYSTAR